MTTADFLALDPREQDALVAEKVMGLDLTAHDTATVARAVFSGFWGNTPDGNQNHQDFKWNGREHRVTFSGSWFNHGDVSGNDGYGLRAWETRHDQPYREDIEAHVESWRAPSPPYTTDISAAWQVVERLEPYHFDLRIFNDGWNCRLCVGTDNSKHWDAYGGRRPRYDQAAACLAICLAALKAKGVVE